MNRIFSVTAVFLGTHFAALGCGDPVDSGGAPGVVVERGHGDVTRLGDGTQVVVTEDGTFVISGDPGDHCVQIGRDCIDVSGTNERYCDDAEAQMDVIVVDGEVVEVICYPTEEDDDTTEQEITDVFDEGNLDVEDDNGSVITFDESTDGEAVIDNLDIDSERVTVYGNGIDVTIIGGNLHVRSNNARVRGLTVQGNVDFSENSNNSALSFCKIYGNLHVDSNSFVGLECQVFGNVRLSGNNGTLVNIGVGGNWDVRDGTLCEGCYSFDDDDGDHEVADAEVGDDLACSTGT
jgi:hypothetical protein